ncbi:MAG: ornithine cyclodeaminase family protein [Dehalococcoidia bacterium]|nr:ornithine cyclodeaminase family protein [Dehalococcoidia bacterium]
MRILSSGDIAKVLDMPEVLDLVEQAFGERGRGRVQMPPKSYLYFNEHGGDLRVMPAFMEGLGQAGVKMVNVHPQNPSRHGLPTVMATIVLFKPETGEPLAIMDGTRITAMRTAAAAGVATRYLARPDSRVLGLIGAGYQSFYQLEAIRSVMRVAECRIYDVVREKAENLALVAAKRLKLKTVTCVSPEEVVRGSDVVVTVTPSTSPIVKNDWVTRGMHFNCVGADAPGKQELEAAILTRATVVIDDWEQASHSGEMNVPFSRGEITRADIGGEIGEIVAGAVQGRTRDDEITVFDTTGLAIQDVVCAWKAYVKAEQEGLGVLMESLCV